VESFGGELIHMITALDKREFSCILFFVGFELADQRKEWFIYSELLPKILPSSRLVEKARSDLRQFLGSVLLFSGA